MAGGMFSFKEVTGALLLVVGTASLAVGGYQMGLGISGNRGLPSEASMLATASEPRPVDGASLYAGSCAGCHGAGGSGGAVGPGLLEAAGWSPGDFAAAVLDGVAPGGRELAPTMPRYRQVGLDGGDATDEQVAALQAYLQSR